ncbi:hypothetical protein [Leuconostoc gasicomitatum]|uniref:hypothetical protein n=1 Tax=Leuconostoc gasicomitatum TaxID=115778 RepID=UPI001CC562C9|nr:hypothetical protein [Leuconostoc gasicomitatum]MBZ5971625.1 hypothetical protein [Leuconostoc gasicomitatum]
MLTLHQARTIQFFMNNLEEYCEYNKISFPFDKLVFKYKDELISANFIDYDFKIEEQITINLRTNYLSKYSDSMFSGDLLIKLINNRKALLELIYQIAEEFQELPESYWVHDVNFMKSNVSLKNYLFTSDDRFTLVSF